MRKKYRIQTGTSAYLVGGAAVAIITGGAFLSFDFDLVVAADHVFEATLLAHGFQREDLIADRLGQYEANRVDTSRLEQARELFRVAQTIDMDYLGK